MVRIFKILFVLMGVQSLSQGVYVDQAAFYTEGNTLLYVQGDVDIYNGGSIENNGDIELTQNWINNAGNTGLINGAPGTVNFIGGNQFINGNSITHFYNVNLQGGFSLKEANQDVIVSNNLDINNAELQVHQNTFHLTNTNPLSLTWNSGFISGDSIGGYFARSTNSPSLYKFPVGSNSLFTSVYRAIDVTPTNSDSNVYGVRLATGDASTDATGTSFTGATGPYDRSFKQKELIEVNPVFYHNIVRMHGNTPANFKMYFFETDHLAQDRRLDGLAQWRSNVPRWEFAATNLEANISGPSDIGSPNHYLSWLGDDFNDDPFALSVMEGLLVFVPQLFSPNGDGANDVLYVRGRKVKEVTFIVYNRWGEKVFETNDKNFGWDGKHRGKDAQSSVYVYYLDAEIEDYGPLQQKGNITLVR